jgi:5-methylcytosine-specific restriction endonuclease McrA
MGQCIRCRQHKPTASFYRHPEMSDGRLNKCIECCKAQAVEYRREWVRANPEKAAEKQRRDSAWRRAKAREARLTPEERKVVAKVKQEYRLKRWKAQNPERAAELNRRTQMARYARKRNAAGSATAEQIRQRWNYYDARCWMCGAKATQTDHVIPLNRGGTDWPANQRPACARCNRAKGDRDYRAFLAATG